MDHQNSANSFSRKYQYDGQEILAELDEYNSTLAVYTHSSLRTDDVLSVDIRSTKLATQEGSYFYLKDALGSIIDVTDGSGYLVQHYVYSSYGKLLKILDSAGADVGAALRVLTSYGWQNRELDVESGMMYFRARYYMTEVGRFVQEDPNPGHTELPITLINKYMFGANNPINFTDPKGESFMDFVIAAVIIVASIYTGGLAGAAAGSAFSSVAVGAAAGAFVGALVGGVIGGVYSELKGNSFEQGFNVGFKIGALFGGIAGGVSGYIGDFGLTTKMIVNFTATKLGSFSAATLGAMVLKTGVEAYLTEQKCKEGEKYDGTKGKCVNAQDANALIPIYSF